MARDGVSVGSPGAAVPYIVDSGKPARLRVNAS
jgi:hypothetical protein